MTDEPYNIPSSLSGFLFWNVNGPEGVISPANKNAGFCTSGSCGPLVRFQIVRTNQNRLVGPKMSLVCYDAVSIAWGVRSALISAISSRFALLGMDCANTVPCYWESYRLHLAPGVASVFCLSTSLRALIPSSNGGHILTVGSPAVHVFSMDSADFSSLVIKVDFALLISDC